MSLSSVELWQRISAAGLAAPMQCRSWAAEVLQRLPPGDAADGLKNLEQLVLLGRLTDYQADLIAGRISGDYRRGAWTLLRPVDVPLWNGWFEATKSNAESKVWVYWLEHAELTRLRPAAPSLPRALRQAQIRSQHLQTILPPEMGERVLQLQVAPLGGLPLTQAVLRSPGLSTRATEIVRQIAEALRAMHVANEPHGRVFPDRVFWDDSLGVTLARDPLCTQPAAIAADACGLIGDGLSKLRTTQFMAPEFLAPGQLPTLGSDIYSLGCLWWWLLTGRPLVQDATPEKQLARQIDVAIPDQSAVNLPQPYLLCLQHCLGKNLAARFSSADELCGALDAAAAAVKKGPHSKPSTVPPVAVKQPAVAKPATTTSPPTQPPAAPIANPKPPARTASAAVAPQAAGPEPQKIDQASAAVASPVQLPVQPPVTRAPAPQAPELKTPVPQAPVPQASVPAPQLENKPQAPATPPAVVPKSSVPTATVATAANTVAGQVSAARKPAAAKSGKSTLSTSTARKKSKRKGPHRGLLMAMGGLGVVSLLLLVLMLSGGLQPSPKQPAAQPRPAPPPTVADVAPPDVKPADPRLEVFQVVAANKDNLWVPPSLPQNIPLDMLPPGGQIFVSLRPQQLFSEPTSKMLMAALNDDLANWLNALAKRTGCGLESFSQVTVAVYGENEQLSTCVRAVLARPQTLGELKQSWSIKFQERVGEQALLVDNEGEAFYVAAQPMSDAQSVGEFSVGPLAMMKEVAELGGAAGPLVSQVEKLWQSSAGNADVSVLVAVPFLFSEGKSLLTQSPTRLSARLREHLGTDMRAALVQMQFAPQWYVESRFVGASDRDAGRISEQLRSSILQAGTHVEEWLAAEPAHSFWRPLAIRYPQMLRAFGEHSRFGVENGIAIANAYLPSEAAPNILLASWIAMQPGATLNESGAAMAGTSAAVSKPLSIEEYLGRPIRLSFDQEPIEVALRLIGEEANSGLPPATPKLRFDLDGDAFERAGITRNQPMRDFRHENLPVRDALTSIAKRGNPVPTVKSTREEDQRLIWVVADDPQSPGQKMISLTTRVAANAAGIALPVEFAPTP